MKFNINVLKTLILTTCFGYANLCGSTKIDIHFSKEPKDVYIQYNLLVVSSDKVSSKKNNCVFDNLIRLDNATGAMKIIFFGTREYQKRYYIESSFVKNQDSYFTTSDEIDPAMGNISKLSLRVRLYKYYNSSTLILGAHNNSPSIAEATIDFIEPPRDISIDVTVKKNKEIIITKSSACSRCTIL